MYVMMARTRKRDQEGDRPEEKMLNFEEPDDSEEVEGLQTKPGLHQSIA